MVFSVFYFSDKNSQKNVEKMFNNLWNMFYTNKLLEKLFCFGSIFNIRQNGMQTIYSRYFSFYFSFHEQYLFVSGIYIPWLLRFNILLCS